jgi:hypothetical protein
LAPIKKLSSNLSFTGNETTSFHSETTEQRKNAAHSHSSYAPSSPRKFMPPFVDRPDHLIRFLEIMFEKLWMYNGDIKPPKEQEERKLIWNTLLEQYLKKFNKESRQKALTLLKDESVDYSTKQELVLCQLKQSDEGIVYLYQKTGHVYGYFTLLDEKESTEQVIQGVREYG